MKEGIIAGAIVFVIEIAAMIIVDIRLKKTYKRRR